MAFPPRKRRKTLESLVKDGKNDELKSIITQSNASDLVDAVGNTLLHFAAKHNNTDIIVFLLNSNHHINARNLSRSTPLFTAVKHRSFDAVEVLLNAGADIFATNAAEQTILGVLIEQNMLHDVFECFIRAMKRSGVDVDTVADMFLNVNYNLEMVLSLHDARVTQTILQRMPEIERVQSQSAIRFAMNSLDLENVRVLLHFGPDKDLRTRMFFENFINLAKGPGMNLQSFETFVRVIDSWDIVDKDGLECFHGLFISAGEEAVRVLLNYEVNVKWKEKFGVDLIAGVFSNRNVDVIELLKTRKFDVNAQGFRKLSALHFALRSGSERNVQFLIDLGADVNIRDEMGKTPVMDNHAWNRNNCLGRILLQHGADIQAVNNAGYPVWNTINADHIKNYVIPHMLILDARGTEIDLRHRVFLNNRLDIYEMCCDQCDLLEVYKLKESVSLLDVLCESTEIIAAALRDEDFTSKVRWFCLENRIVPYYSDSLEMKLKRALVVHRSKCNLVRIVSGYAGYVVDNNHLVVKKIFGFLRYRDMCSFVELFA